MGLEGEAPLHEPWLSLTFHFNERGLKSRLLHSGCDTKLLPSGVPGDDKEPDQSAEKQTGCERFTKWHET